MPKVSIIMGIYNCESVLSNSIDSILEQTYKDWELIMCDDGSSDNTYKVAEQYKEQYPEKIILIKHDQNKKLAATLNDCLEAANGQYIARMDSDDLMLPERLEKQVEFLDQNKGVAVVGCSAKIFDGEKINEIRKAKLNPSKNDVLLGPPFMHPAIMMRKETYDALGGYTVSKRTQRGQDWDLWFRFFAAGYKGANLEEPMMVYHESPDDYKKRTLKAAIGCTKTAYYGYKQLNVPKTKYIYLLKPVVSYFVPEELKRKLRKR